MRHTRSRITITAVIAAAALAACGGTDEPTQSDYDDTAQAIGPIVSKDLASNGTVATATAVSRGDAPSWLSAEASGSLAGSAGALDWTLTTYCEDDGGNELDVCDERTDAAEITVHVSGTLQLSHYSASLTIDGAWTLDQLQSDEIVATGDIDVTAASEFTALTRPVMRTFDLAITGTYDLLVPVDEPGAARGTLGATVDARSVRTESGQEDERHLLIDVLVELDGAGEATITLDGENTYLLDIEAGTVVRI